MTREELLRLLREDREVQRALAEVVLTFPLAELPAAARGESEEMA